MAPSNHTHACTHTQARSFRSLCLPPRIQRGVSMETRTRQWSVFKPKVHPVGEGGSTEILQQTGRKSDDITQIKDVWKDFNNEIASHSLWRLETPKQWWKLRPSMPPSSRLRSATPAACRSPTWKTTAQETSLSSTATRRYPTHGRVHELPFKEGDSIAPPDAAMLAAVLLTRACGLGSQPYLRDAPVWHDLPSVSCIFCQK